MQMMGVDGQWNAGLEINGTPLPISPSLVEYAQIIESIHQTLPSVQIKFKDVANHGVAKLTIGQGSTVNLALGNKAAGGDPVPILFECEQSPDAYSSGTSIAMEIRGVLSHLPWKRKVVEKSYNGTSSSVISQLASEAGLIPDTHGTSDSQPWLPNGKPLAQFADFVAQRGYAGGSSAMQLAVTRFGTLRYYDLTQAIGAGSLKQFTNVPQNSSDVMVLQWSATPKQGLANNAYAMGATQRVLKLDGEIHEFNKVVAPLMGAGLGFLSSAASSLGGVGGRLTRMAIDCNNVHDKYYEAQNQNTRIKSTFAFDVQVLTDVPTGLQLLDAVDFVIYAADGAPLDTYTGKYLVTTVTCLIKGTRYYEKLTLTSQAAA